MRKPVVLVLLLVAAATGAGVWYARLGDGKLHYTGFVEGEERVLRSEVNGRVLEVAFAEGDPVPAGAVVARLDDTAIRSQIAAKEQEIAVLTADVARHDEQLRLVESTWKQEVEAQRADVEQVAAAADLAERTFARERDLAATGASTQQHLDDARSRRDQARSALERSRKLLARSEAEEGTVAVAQRELDVSRRRLELARAELGELEVTLAKHTIHAPAVPTVAQTQFTWPAELAQPGTAILSVLDPRDKYVQLYVPVPDLGRLHVGQRVRIELDSAPGRFTPGEISFIASQANFTPEKIETRSDRLGQVYRVKVRILEDVERFRPGTEGNVYPDGDAPAAASHG
jgi:HlyD family secretion protein